MKKYFAIFFGILLGSSSCQQKETKNVDVKKQAQIDANLGVINSLRNAGDKLTASREVFHWIYFKNEIERKKYSDKVRKENFEVVEETYDQNIELPFGLKIKRLDHVDYNHIDEYTLYLWQLAKNHNADYDGWETSVEKD